MKFLKDQKLRKETRITLLTDGKTLIIFYICIFLKVKCDTYSHIFAIVEYFEGQIESFCNEINMKSFFLGTSYKDFALGMFNNLKHDIK